MTPTIKPSTRIMEIYQAELKRKIGEGNIIDFPSMSAITYSDSIVQFLDEEAAKSQKGEGK